jgi:hypothetical protein
MKRFKKIMIFVVIGGVLGYVYYSFVGCSTGACPITSHPLNTILYGGVIGLILGSVF